jgi:hypothetical protein
MTETLLGTVDEVMGVVLPKGVKSISGDAFDGCVALRSLTIQPGCVEIEDGTLKVSEGGPEVYPEAAIGGCVSLVVVTIPFTCLSIGRFAFYSCSSLSQLAIPSSVTRIGECAFGDCSGLTHVRVPPGVTNIGNYVFVGCTRLAQVTMPWGVTSIGASAFRDCSSLAQVVIPSSVMSIGAGAFYGCSGLTQLTLPSDLRSVEDYAFYGCAALRLLTVPANLAEIGGGCDEVFKGVTTLECVTLVGCPLDPVVVEAVEPALAPGAKVVSRVLAGQKFGGSTIIAAP